MQETLPVWGKQNKTEQNEHRSGSLLDMKTSPELKIIVLGGQHDSQWVKLPEFNAQGPNG